MLDEIRIALTIALPTIVGRRAAGEVARGPEVGAVIGLASTLGTPGQDVALGYVVSPYFGYEFANGLAPFATVQYGR